MHTISNIEMLDDERAENREASDAERKRFDVSALAHFDFVWRAVRRLGLSESDAEEVCQQALITLSKNISVVCNGSERAYLLQAALHNAAHVWRSRSRRGELSIEDFDGLQHAGETLDDLLDQRKARQLLDNLLDGMQPELRLVFVLFEIDEMSTSEIADLLNLPAGTVASRLRRARDEFHARLQRVESKWSGGRGVK